jgi:hypothetical protein
MLPPPVHREQSDTIGVVVLVRSQIVSIWLCVWVSWKIGYRGDVDVAACVSVYLCDSSAGFLTLCTVPMAYTGELN